MSVVLITGCSSGFGFASALAFARAGDTVYASMRQLAKAEPLLAAAAREGLTLHPIELDVTKPVTFERVIATILASSQRLDVLVNNAGILRPGAFEDLDETALRDVLETNFFAPFLLTRAVLPVMRAQRSGYIIMISSLSGIAGLPGDVAYAASKFAMEGATEALRHEVDRWGIKLALVQAALSATQLFETGMSAMETLPRDYPANSPYRELIEHRMRELRARLTRALDPMVVGNLLVEISRSGGRQLRWPADALSKAVLAKMLGQNDAQRDAFLREVSGTDWWSNGGSLAPPDAAGA